MNLNKKIKNWLVFELENIKFLIVGFQMRQAIHAAATRAFTQMLFADGANIINQYIELNVSRNNLVEDAIRELSQYTQHDYKRPLKVIA